MFSKLHQRLGTAGLIVAVVALVVALAGTAFAAAGLNGKEKKEVKKIAQKFAGKPGAPGAPGPTGPKGETGAKGDKGDPGTNGTNGTAGTNGKSVVVGTATSGTGGECPEGGATVQVAGEAATKKAVCNGSPWTAGGTLPKGETETGMWSFGQTASGTEVTTHTQYVSLSFNIPLAAPMELGNVIYVAAPGEHAAQCPGTMEEPKAAAGFLCLYQVFVSNAGSAQPLFPSTGGVLVQFEPTSITTAMYGFGSWAVTAS